MEASVVALFESGAHLTPAIDLLGALTILTQTSTWHAADRVSPDRGARSGWS